MAKKTGPGLKKKTTFLHRLRTSFLTGLVVVAPIGLTIWLLWTIVSFVDAQVVPLLPEPLRDWVDIGVPGVGVVIFVVFTAVVGYFAKNLFGRQIIRLGESWVERMPVVRSIYNAVKQITETIFTQSKASFQKACLVEYPRRGIWSIAFISTDTKGEIPGRAGEPDMVSVFLPTTPNPTSGFLLFVPRADVRILDMTVEEAAKLIISAGLVAPPEKEATALPGQAKPAPGKPGTANGGGAAPRVTRAAAMPKG